MNLKDLYNQIVDSLISIGKQSKYHQDADERDPRYKAYGVRAPQKEAIIKSFKKDIAGLSPEEKSELTTLLVHSEMGEQQTVSFYVMEQNVDFYTPEKLSVLDEYITHMFGWSKIDGFAGAVMPKILLNYPKEVIQLVRRWNKNDEKWIQRASVVLYTRNIAESGKFNDELVDMIWNLRGSKEDLVLKAIGWGIKDMMRSDKERSLELFKNLRVLKIPSIVTSYALRDFSISERKDILSKLKEK